MWLTRPYKLKTLLQTAKPSSIQLNFHELEALGAGISTKRDDLILIYQKGFSLYGRLQKAEIHSCVSTLCTKSALYLFAKSTRDCRTSMLFRVVSTFIWNSHLVSRHFPRSSYGQSGQFGLMLFANVLEDKGSFETVLYVLHSLHSPTAYYHYFPSAALCFVRRIKIYNAL